MIEHMTARAKLALNNPAFHIEGGHTLYKNVLEIPMHKGLNAIDTL